ncbi:juvenile hormone esterase-like [Helicoverpa zea]|uniref:juvenile hormone esterase-like n=1 Tax=Helicoverpa zea TaxID=7113 RepID=UPI001F58DCB8|nr:juvenile hormone esterase-like [Helicoverpa zea]
MMYCGIYVFIVLLTQIKSFAIEVTVKQGKIIGHREVTVFNKKLYFAFYAVPYAKPPVGRLRFKDPKPVQKWEGIHDATREFHGACAQAHIVHKHGQFGVEDCLYLNIYTPEIPRSEMFELKPVIVWLHGYAFASSFSHIHGGDFLVDNDIVLVTATHRIGVFGFLKLSDDDSNANMGLKDIVMALKWIRTNIKQFGGDKDNITLMGSNSAATFISLLMMTEASKLFSKVILQSGAIYSASIMQGDHKLERERLTEQLSKNGLKISNAPTKALIDASQTIYTRSEVENYQRPIVSFTPILETKSKSALLTKTPNDFYDIMKSNTLKPLLIGFNTQESISEMIPFIHNPYYLRLFRKFFKFMVPFSDGCKYNSTSQDYKRISDQIKARYFKDEISEKSLYSFLRYTSDLIKFPIIKFIRTYLQLGGTNAKLYMYKFDYRGRLNAVKGTSIADSKVQINGVATGDEICYVLKCEPLWEEYVKMTREDVNRDKTFIKQMSGLWSNFARYGDPTPPNEDVNITWPTMTLDGSNVLLIRASMTKTDFKGDNSVYDFWNNIYERFYKEEHCKPRHDEL